MRIISRSHRSHKMHRAISLYQRGLLVCAFTFLLLLSAALYQAPRVYAGTTGPLISWDGTMIYPGQNNGNPEGPVGETAVVHGQNFTANAGQQLKLILVSGDVTSNPSACQGSNFVATVSNSTTVSASGTFDASFTWPGAANHVNGKYSICSLLASDGSAVSSVDSGPFTVLTASAPTLGLSASNVAPGDTLTISGKNWVPPQPLNIAIAGCADCDPGNSLVTTATTSSTGLNSGSFSVNVPIPATSTPGNYVVNVFSQSGPLDAFHLSVGSPHLTVTTPQATPTPTVVPSPSPSVTATAAASPTASTTGTSGSSGGSNGFLLFIVIAMAVLLLAIIGIIIYILYQRNKQGPPDDTSAPFNPPSQPGAGPMNRYSGVGGGTMTPFPPGPGQQNQFNSSPDNRYAGSGYGNWQGTPGYNDMQQGQFVQRSCVRCGSPLNPNSLVCGRCGMRNALYSDPDGPTVAY